MGNIEAVRLLLNHDSKCDVYSRYHCTCVYYALYNDIIIANEIISLIINNLDTDDEKCNQFINPDRFGWNAIAIAAKSGTLHSIEWNKYNFLMSNFPVNHTSKRHFSLVFYFIQLHYASWNCRNDDIIFITHSMDYWKLPLELNIVTEENGYSELDLAV